jgi:hypothetical protein
MASRRGRDAALLVFVCVCVCARARVCVCVCVRVRVRACAYELVWLDLQTVDTFENTL